MRELARQRQQAISPESKDEIQGLTVFIHCISCRAKLWEQTLLKTLGDKVASRQCIPAGSNALLPNQVGKLCPLCGEPWCLGKQHGQLISGPDGRMEII